ncbi:MFS transporter [Actinoplanes utahensis]|uniref:MFS transporter n=1 Tax=Actinoplanes utahensis TaxID=1869 RepID=UPI0006920BD2|nr:MFS transporter [Actinoplanes utahensis]GIF31387.1 MFS transporter [Actinoplanes utahensis]
MRRNAVLFVLISVLSGFGGTALTLAAGIWILDLTGNPGLAALGALGTYAPSLAAPWLGALVDRFPRRTLLICTEITLGLTMLSLLAVSNAGHTWLIYAVMVIRGIGYVLSDAGESALLPAALSTRLLGDVNGWRSSAQEGMKLLAPLAGAALYASAGPRPVVLLCATLPLLGALLYTLITLTPAPSHPAPAAEGGDKAAAAPQRTGTASVQAGARVPAAATPSAPEGPGPERVVGEGRVTLGWGSVRQGLVVLVREPLRTPVLVAAVAIAVSGLTNAAVLSRLVDGLHLPSTHLGILSSAQGAGSLIAGLVVGRLLARMPAARVAAIGAVVFAVACVAWTLPWWPTMIAGNVLAGAGLVWALIAAVTAVQSETPAHLLGRVAATSNTALFGPVAIAIPLGAALVHVSDRLVLAVGAMLVVFTVLRTRRRLGLSRRAR